MKNDTFNLEQQYMAATAAERRKALGQVFTPPRIARLMTRWVTANLSRGRLLDPALGLGIFFRCLPTGRTMRAEGEMRETAPADFPYSLEGYEVDPEVAALAGEDFARRGIPLTCHLTDFLPAEIEPVYDGIVCNPPYIHFQEYTHSLSLIQKFNRRYGMELTGFSNIYALFLVKALHLLRAGGRAAFILPLEFLNADYGTSIKSFLVETHSLAKMIIFHPSVQVFPGFLTTSAIFLFEQGWTGDLEMFTVHRFDELDEIESLLYPTGLFESTVRRKRYNYDQLVPEVKWRPFYSDMKILLPPRRSANLTPLHTFANVRRGIATGANRFFTLSKAERQEHNIDMKYLTPCLTKASQAQYHIFEEDELSALREAGKKVFLLNLNGKALNPAVREYIRRGEEEGFDAGYLTRNRKPWYSTEPMTPADLWVKTFGRGRVVFIENKSSALHLTCFHGIYLNRSGQQYRRAMVLYLTTDLAREIFEGQKREYGSGLGKFEPNDIRNAYLIDFRRIRTEDLATLDQLYEEYLRVYQNDSPATAEITTRAENIFVKYW